MTPEDVMKRVEAIREKAWDDEVAHAEEDSLHCDVLEAVALGQCEDPEACAFNALKTLEIEFARWCA